jgi:hypothetical protein
VPPTPVQLVPTAHSSCTAQSCTAAHAFAWQVEPVTVFDPLKVTQQTGEAAGQLARSVHVRSATLVLPVARAQMSVGFWHVSAAPPN